MPDQDDKESINLGQIDAEEVSINTGQRVIVVTEDKLRLQLMQHRNALQARERWIAPLGVSLAILLALITTEFRDVGLTAAVWQAIFIISFILSLGWLVATLIRRPKRHSIEQLIGKIKETPEQ